jgi:hypothetical protein
MSEVANEWRCRMELLLAGLNDLCPGQVQHPDEL